MKYFVLAIFLTLFTGCASNPNGSTWAYTDLNKYDKNYEAFPTNQLRINQNKEEVLTLLGNKYELVEAGSNYQVLSYKQWVSVMGPDYVAKTLYVKLENNKLSSFKITDDTVSIVPRSW